MIGHRGCAGEYPENTLVSFEAALAQGADILESDVHVSRDGVPLLLHDPTLERTCGLARAASALSLAEIRALDAGWGHLAPDGARPFAGQGHRIATLEEAFARFPQARFNLELKCGGEAVFDAVLRQVARFERAERTLLTAGEDEIMSGLRAAVARRGIRPALGASVADVLAAISSALDGKSMPDGVMALQIPPSFAGQPLVTRPLVEHAHAQGVAVHVWTVNDRPEAEALLALGVDGLVTDFPGRLARWLADGLGR